MSTLHANGEPRRAHESGAALSAARRRKERTYPELVGRPGRARLVVLGVEAGGRWSAETQSFLSSLARARARVLYLGSAWSRRGDSGGGPCSLAQCRAVAMSLLEVPGVRGGLTAIARRPMTWNGISDTQVWIRDPLPPRALLSILAAC